MDIIDFHLSSRPKGDIWQSPDTVQDPSLMFRITLQN